MISTTCCPNVDKWLQFYVSLDKHSMGGLNIGYGVIINYITSIMFYNQMI